MGLQQGVGVLPFQGRSGPRSTRSGHPGRGPSTPAFVLVDGFTVHFCVQEADSSHTTL